MKTMSYTESRARYAEMLDGVINDREEVVITRAGHEPVVVVSLEDYESLKETAYLMRSPANARRLLDAMERLESGRGVPTSWSTRLKCCSFGTRTPGRTTCGGRPRTGRALKHINPLVR